MSDTDLSDNHLHDDNSSEARVAWLLSARAVREQAQAIFAATLRGDSEHFTIDEDGWPVFNRKNYTGPPVTDEFVRQLREQEGI